MPEPYHLQFLQAEERATAILIGFFEDARLELEEWIAGDRTSSESTFFRKLLDETNRIASSVQAKGAEWTSTVIPEAYSAGWRASSSVVVPQAALEALSRSTLGLITQTTDGIRQTVRQAIATAILRGSSADELRAKIIASGLTNIPHWPTVDYRAGVIARTETMAAFNQGIDDVSTELGAAYFEWITSPDEAVCPICLPRDGVIFTNPRVQDPTNAYPAAQPCPKLPAHPRCRCTKRSVYRGPDGKVIRQGATEVEPTLPKDAMGGRDEPTVPAAVGDMQKAIGALPDPKALRRLIYEAERMGTLNPGLGIDDPRMLAVKAEAKAKLDPLRAFWRTADLDERTMRMLAGLEGGTAAAARRKMAALFELRYGIEFNEAGAWSTGSMLSSLKAIETLRAVAPRWVVDSSFLTHWGSAPATARRMSGNRAAEMYATCHMRPNFSSMKTYVHHVDGYSVGVEDTLQTVLVHELGHSVHNRYGAHASTGYAAVEFGGDVYERIRIVREFEDEWTALRQATGGKVAPTVKALNTGVDEIKQRLATWEARNAGDPTEGLPGGRWAGVVATLKKELAAAEALAASGPVGEYYPTDYARKGGYKEDFAESFMLYLLSPERLKAWSPGRFEFMQRRIFGQ